MELKPIFILGAPRSGTTLLRVMLNSHSRVCIPHECKVVAYVAKLYNPAAVLNPDQVSELCLSVSKLPRFREVFGQVENIVPLYDQVENITPVQFLAILYCMHNEDGQIRYWGDKNIGYSWIAEILSDYFSSSKFIHIVRDPRDVSYSTSKRLGKLFKIDSGGRYFIRHCYGAALLWKNEQDRAQKLKRKLARSRYYEVRYEDLVRDPKYYTRAICSFLDLEFESNMIEGLKQGELRGVIPDDSLSKFHENIKSAPTTEHIGKGLSINRKNLVAIEKLCREAMLEHGYVLQHSNDHSFCSNSVVMMVVSTYRIQLLLYRFWLPIAKAKHRVALLFTAKFR